MTRTLSITIAVVLGLAAAAHADGPSPADLAKAKKAYVEGKDLHDKHKLDEAVVKFKESYRLSKNPLLLYNIGLTYEEMGVDTEDLALVNYRKFLADAPADAAQRPDVEARIAALQKKLGTGTEVKPTEVKPTEVKPTEVKPVVKATIKPAGTYAPTEFQHQVVMEAPPGKPLDVTAFVPEDSGWTVTLFFRGAGDTKFYSKAMRWRYKELVGRIPAAKIGGQSIQYYVEVKDQAGTVVTRSGKATSPNLVDVEQTAQPRFYPDWNDDGAGEAATPTEIKHRDLEEDPLHKKTNPVEDPIVPVGPVDPNGPTDTFVGSSKFRYAKWGTTVGAVAFIALGVTFYLQAGSYATQLADDLTTDCATGAKAPCHMYDDYDRNLQTTGQRYQTFSRVMLPLGVIAGGVAGYLWYREHKAKSSYHASNASPDAPTPTPKGPAHDELSWMVTPSIGDGFAGAAALVTF